MSNRKNIVDYSCDKCFHGEYCEVHIKEHIKLIDDTKDRMLDDLHQSRQDGPYTKEFTQNWYDAFQSTYHEIQMEKLGLILKKQKTHTRKIMRDKQGTKLLDIMRSRSET